MDTNLTCRRNCIVSDTLSLVESTRANHVGNGKGDEGYTPSII